jgi:SAM-dependent methyltransferase
MEALYDHIGIDYKNLRKPDSRIAAIIEDALGNSSSVLNVGAGAGSYEPINHNVIALEPSIEMIRQRVAHAAPVVQGIAELLPFSDKAFSAALAILTVHHWKNQSGGIRELLRIARDRVVIMAFDPEQTRKFWLVQDYLPEIAAIDFDSLSSINTITQEFTRFEIRPVPVPCDCSDGFLGAYWQRPHAYLEPDVRNAISVFSKIEDIETGLSKLQHEIENGVWLQKYGYLGRQQELDLGYRLIIAELH